jgi:hypothetical protein
MAEEPERLDFFAADSESPDLPIQVSVWTIQLVDSRTFRITWQQPLRSELRQLSCADRVRNDGVSESDPETGKIRTALHAVL